MELTINQALQQAILAHKEGRLQEAERFYRAILQKQPKNPDANHNLGVLAVAVGKPLEAIPRFKLALKANPQIEQFWLSYIDTLIRLERFEEANRVLVEGEKAGVFSNKLDALNQRHQESLPNDTSKTKKGQTLSEKRKQLADKKKSKKRKAQGGSSSARPSQDQCNKLLEHYHAGRLAEAEALATSLTRQFPKHPFGLKILGIVLAQTGRSAESLAPLQATVKLSPQDAEAHNNLGYALQLLGRLKEAAASYGQATTLKPDFAEAHNNLGNTLSNLGKLHEAEASYREAIALKPDFAEAHRNRGVTLKGLGRLEDAEASHRKAIALKPDYAEAHNNLGNTLKELGKLEGAEASYEYAIALKPDYAEAHNNLANTLEALGKLDEAESSYGKAIALKPDFAEAHSNRGITLKRLGRLDDAEASHRKAIAFKPDHAEAHNNLGTTLKALGKLDDAEASYRKAIAIKPNSAEAHYNLGNVLKDLGRLDEAEGSNRKAIALNPDYAQAHLNLGNTLDALGKSEDAEASYRKAVALLPDYPAAHNNLGGALQVLGRLTEAEASYRKAIELKSDYAEAHRNLASMRNFSFEDEQFLQMQALYRDPATSEKNRCHICFALAKAYEDLRDFGRAFQFYAEGNALRKKELGYDKAQDKQLFERLKAKFQQRSDAVGREIAAPEHSPVFIVGMPRSGTTLVEQIISSHPLVTGAGELPFISQLGGSLAISQSPADSKSLATFREGYLSALKERSEGKAIVIDKMPHNFRFIGLIATALPEAKIIHVKRDPAAVCWANYTMYFIKDALGYCYDLDDILHYFELYQDLMRYWHQAFPSKIYDLQYETLTQNQEEQTRKLLNYLELPWNDACLSPQDNTRRVNTASNVQVRQKVYQGSSEKWKRYQPYLNRVLERFGESNEG